MTLSESTSRVVQELAAAVGRVSDEQAEAVIDVLRSARTIVIAGVGREGLAARSFAMRLMHLGLDSHWVWDDTCPPVSVGDLLVVVSGSGAIGHLDHVAKMAKEAGSTVVVVTAVPGGETSLRADHVLHIPAQTYKGVGDLTPSIQPMGSLFEESVWICFDGLVLELVQRAGLAFRELAERHRNVE